MSALLLTEGAGPIHQQVLSERCDRGRIDVDAFTSHVFVCRVVPNYHGMPPRLLNLPSIGCIEIDHTVCTAKGFQQARKSYIFFHDRPTWVVAWQMARQLSQANRGRAALWNFWTARTCDFAIVSWFHAYAIVDSPVKDWHFANIQNGEAE